MPTAASRPAGPAACGGRDDDEEAAAASITLRAEAERVVLSYRFHLAGGEWQDVEEPVGIARAPCRLGGDRPYFLCPGVVDGVVCGRRVAKLRRALGGMTSPPDQPERHFPAETTAQGPWGGPVYSYRGAEIRCAKGGHVCSLFVDGHPLNGSSFGVVGPITPLIDLWVEERRLPGYMRSVLKAGARLVTE